MAKKRRVEHRKKSFKKEIIIIILFVLVAASAFYFSKHDKVAATVNGRNIYENKVQLLYDSLPQGSTLTKKALLQRIIDLKVFVIYIEDKGYNMTGEQFEKELNKRLSENNLTLSELQEQLTLKGQTLEDTRDSFEIEWFVTNVVLPNIHVTKSEFDSYKAKNPTLTDDEIKKLTITIKQRDIVNQIIQNQLKKTNVKIYAKY